MRTFSKLAIATLVACVAVQMVSGRQQPGAGLGQILGGKQAQDPATLLRNKDVKTEIKLTKEQEEKIAAAFLEALTKVLEPDQLKRLKQISLQTRDYTAFGDPSIQDELKLNDEQRKDMTIILGEADKKKADLQAATKKGMGGGANNDKLQSLNKETIENCKEVLTAEQRRLYAEMLGDEFKFTAAGALGGFDFNNLNGIDLKNLDLKNLDLNNLKDLFKGLKKGGGGR